MGTNFFDVSYDSNLDVVVMKWEGYFTSKQFREKTLQMGLVLKQNSCHKVLALISGLTLIGAEDQKWLLESFLPTAIAQGFQAIAIIKPSNYFNQIAIENISSWTDKKLDLRVFEVESDAREWLGSLNVAIQS